MKIVVVGSINKDIVLKVNNIAKNGETISASNESIFIGGKGYNQAVAISKVHKQTYFYCNVNKNDFDIIDTIHSQRFNSEGVQQVDSNTGTAYIQVDNQGENCIVLSGNANKEINITNLETYLSAFSKGDYLVLQNEINNLYEIILMAKEKGFKIILNPSPMNDVITKDIVKNVDVFFVNQPEALKITNTNTIDDMINTINDQYSEKEFIVTLGSKGAMHLHNNEQCKVKAHNVDVIDTTCAGDTFLGYFIGYRAMGKDINTCLKYATKAASISIGRNGASQSIPNKDEVQI